MRKQFGHEEESRAEAHAQTSGTLKLFSGEFVSIPRKKVDAIGYDFASFDRCKVCGGDSDERGMIDTGGLVVVEFKQMGMNYKGAGA